MSEPIFVAGRSAVYGRGGMVAASQPLAVAAGLEVLSGGGNAADAAVAVAAALNVTEPTSTGIGGDMFALFFEGGTRKISALNGSGRAPAALTLERLRKEGFAELPPYHPYTITVPGACAGWFDLIEKHGTKSMGEILAPAIRLGEEGFPVAPLTSYFWQRGAARQLRSAPNGIEMTLDGRGPGAGEIFKNPGLARTFRKIAEGGRQAFYQGEIAEAIAGVVQEAGGCLTVEDLREHSSSWEAPISTTYRGYRVYECPPNGQGLAALIALNLLEGFDLGSLDPISPDRLHLEVEALRLAFADARWYVSDPKFSDTPLDQLLSKGYATERRKLIDPRRARLDQKRGAGLISSDTVYFSVVDRTGNACSFINSNYMGFGTGIVPKGWGFTLQNRGHNFDLDPGHPNGLRPRKRPYHTIIPAMATRESDGSLFASFGVMGGFMQPQGHVQVFTAMADSGLNPQAALELPRFCIEDGTASGALALEEGIPDVLALDLAERGHRVKKVAGWERALFGRGQIILRDPARGVLTGGSDPRADGCAASLI
ncbi:MAG TPA: gamma-glutamyltransferase family protein [Anaerolineales bacterium]|nr:gamma-glutamyltransferase family protein [Anaerolineales bacterium]